MGEIVSDFAFSHEIFGEGFYMVDVRVERLSDSIDIIPLMVSERLLDVNGDYKGMYIVVNGQFRSYNRHEERKNKLVLSVFAREIDFVDEIGENTKSNQIYLDGYICKEPVYRPLIGFDKRDIVELAEKIGTFETSIQPFEDCCTIFVAKHPVTKPNLNIIRKHEHNLDEKIEELVRTALETKELIVVK